MLQFLIDNKAIIIAIFFILLVFLESIIPAYQLSKKKWQHDFFNLIIGLVNVLLTALVLSLLFSLTSDIIKDKEIGLSYVLGHHSTWTLIATLLLFDCCMYFWHRLNHRVPFLWQFHALHHIDEAMDASSAVRFHFVEIILSCLYRLPLMFVLGMPLEWMLLYEVCLLPVILFHHSAIKIPQSLETCLAIFIVTPGIHRVHHSPKSELCHSNYSSILSIWDRLFGSFKGQSLNKDMTYGLKGMHDDSRIKSIISMYLLKFLQKNKPKND